MQHNASYMFLLFKCLVQKLLNGQVIMFLYLFYLVNNISFVEKLDS